MSNKSGIACLSLDNRQILSSLIYEHIQCFGVFDMKVLPEAIFHSAKCVCSVNKQYFSYETVDKQSFDFKTNLNALFTLHTEMLSYNSNDQTCSQLVNSIRKK